MASAAFKSTTKRTLIGAYSSTDDSGSSSHGKPHRRSRSLSRFSRSLTESDISDGPPRGKFVNTVRGSEFPEISLDDLAVELFSDEKDRGRARSSFTDPSDSSSTAATAPQRRGRSVSRNSKHSEISELGHNSRRRRSVSVARCQASNTVIDMGHSLESGHTNESTSVNKHSTLSRRYSLGSLSNNNDSNSAVTDGGRKDNYTTKYGRERTIRAVYAEKAEHPAVEDVNGRLRVALRRELKHAVDEIRVELEQRMVKSEALNCLKTKSSDITKMLLKEEHGRGLTEMAREVDDNAVTKPSRTRKRSNDRKKMSKWLNEEAEKYFEDFISSIEDSDFSSFDGERSDASSTLYVGTNTNPLPSDCNTAVDSQKGSLSIQLDGVVFPWLQWETTHDSSPMTCQKKIEDPLKSFVPNFTNTNQEGRMSQEGGFPSSSRGSCSPGDSLCTGETSDGRNSFKKFTEYITKPRAVTEDNINEYASISSTEDFLLQVLQQRQRINSGCLLICDQ